MSSNSKTEPRTLAGFLELLPNKQVLFNEMLETIKKSYELYGFLPLDTPIVELSEVLLAKAGGETEKQIYRIDKGGDCDSVLRFDLTVPLAKYVSMHYPELAFPFRRYQIGKVYRGEKPQKGRFREFYQCDIDIIGDGELNIINDAEIPSIIYSTFKKLNIGEFTIFINNRKILNGLFSYLNLNEISTEIMRAIDKIDKMGVDCVKSELEMLGIDIAKIQYILSFIAIDGTTDEKISRLKSMDLQNEVFISGVTELEQVVRYIRFFNVPDKYFTIDLRIARGLDYYTGTVYETFLDNHKKIGSVCSGGRYDNLAEYYTENKLPGVGISIGLTRLFYQLCEHNIIEITRQCTAEVLILPLTSQIDYCIQVANSLRNIGINTEVYFGDKKIKTKMKYASKVGVPYIILIGDNEINSKILTVKNMNTGIQEQLTLEQLLELIKI